MRIKSFLFLFYSNVCKCITITTANERWHSLSSAFFEFFFDSRCAFWFRLYFCFAHTFHCLINFYLTFGSQSAAKNKSQIKKLNARDSNNSNRNDRKMEREKKLACTRERDEWRKMYSCFSSYFRFDDFISTMNTYSLAAFSLSQLSILIFVGVFFAINL